MFVYTVYGAPGTVHREPGRRISAVSRVEPTRPTERSWVVQRQNDGQPQRAYEMRRARDAYPGALYALASASPTAAPSRESAPRERIGDLPLTGGARQLLLEYRRPKSALAPNFSGYIDKLGEIRRVLQSQRAEQARGDVGIAQI